MAREVVSTPSAAPPVGPYVTAVRSGELIFCSGVIGLEPATGELVDGGFDAELERVLANIELLLADCGCTTADVVKATVFLVDITDGRRLNERYAEFFGADVPARSTVAVAALPLGSRVEIELVLAAPATDG
jgi:2-iminobutanoate/2-iminopropanoate deaminase